MASFIERAEKSIVGVVDFVTKLPQKGHEISSELNDYLIDLSSSYQNTKRRSATKARENLTSGRVDSLVLRFADWIQTTEGAIVSAIALFIIYKIFK